jgi:hypothetical protein
VLLHQPEAQLAALLGLYASARSWEWRHPVAALKAAVLLRAIPPLRYTPSPTREGQIIRRHLRRTSAGVSTVLHQATTTLQLPEQPGTFLQGRERATLRRHSRKAEKLGVTWSEVHDPVEKEALLALATAFEREHGLEEYREASPDLSELRDIDLWLVASLHGTPVLLSVTAIDGDWSLLRYFRVLQQGEAATAARYLMTGVLAEQLVDRGVRWLCDTRNALRLPTGLRHFSRMVGFRTRRVRVS